MLLDVLQATRQFFQKNSEVSIEQWQDFICDQARFETVRRSEKIFLRFLLWAPGVSPIVERNLNLRQGSGPLWPIASEILGSRWDLTAHCADAAAQSNTRQIDPSKMRLAILAALPAKPLQEKKRPGRHRVVVEQKTSFRVGLAVENAISQFTEFIAVRRSFPKRVREDPRLLRTQLGSKGFSKDQIDAGISSKTAIIAARYFIAVREERDFDIVAKYHRAFRKTRQGPTV